MVSGQATITQQGKQLTIVNSPSAVIHWKGFSIGSDEVTRFTQQSPASAVLNRVVGQDPSKILGTLTSNGRVFLINPNGILFGAAARVDVAGLVASSLQLSDKDFIAGRLRFTDTPGAKGVENQGVIQTAAGGEVLLIAPDVKNSGVITSPKGEVILAAGKSVEIVDPKSPHLRVEITAPENEAVNLGTIVADGGRVSIYATSIRNAGRIQANTVERTQAGEIVLRAKKDVTLEKTSVITASGEAGGKVTIQAESGTATVNGVVEARALAPEPLPSPIIASAAVPTTSSSATTSTVTTSVTSSALTSEPAPAPVETPTRTAAAAGAQPGAGGTVQILGEKVALLETHVDASGSAAGGTILIGGDYQGKNPAIQNARLTYVGPNATLTVDATDAGAGGRAIVWADQSTYFAGTLTARGGINGGDGGFVETSGKGTLIVRRAPDVSARRNGRPGTWLLDPTDINIVATDTATPNTEFNVNTFEEDPLATDPVSEITVATLMTALQGGNVIISTASSAASAGNITWTGAMTYTGAGPRALTLNADGNIVINTANITSNVLLNFVLNPGTAGTVSIAGTVSLSGGTLSIGGTAAANTSSATIQNARLATPDGASISGGVLDGVTIDNSLTFTGSTTIRNNVTLANGVTVNKGASQWSFNTTGTQHIAVETGTATINNAGGFFVAGSGVGGQTLVIDSGITIQGHGQIFDSATAPVINAGTIVAASAGQVFTVASSTFSNTGLLKVTAGTMTISSPNWTSTGTMQVDAGTLNLGGTLTAGTFNTIVRPGAGAGTVVNVTGTFDGAGGTLDIGSAGQFGNGGLNGLSGTLKSLTLVSTDLTQVPGGGILDGVTLGSNLTFAGSAAIRNHITLAPGIVVSKGAQQWSFNTTGTQHIATSGVGATINNAGGFFVAGSGVGGQTLVIDSGITIQGHGQIFDSATAPVINAGTIVAASAGQVFTVASSTFSNTGLLKVTAGTMTISSPNWTSTGTMQVDAGTLNLGGTLTAGTFNTIVRPGAGAGTVVNVTGTFDGAGGTLDIGSAGQFGNGGLNGLSGTLKSLTLVSTDLTQVPGGGILDGVTLGSNLTFAGSAAIRNHITLAPGIVVSKGAQQWSFNTTGTQHIATSGVGATINNAGGFFVAGSGVGGQTLVIDSGITIQGHGQIFDSATAPVINAGTIVAASAGQVFTVASSTFSNTGLLKVTAGTMTISSPNWTSTGTMQVDAGTLNLGGTLTAGTFNTIVRPGAGAGTVVNVTGTFDGAGGTLDIGSAGQFGNGGLNGLSGTLKSLTLVSTDLTQVPGGGILDGVTLGSNLTFAGSAAIRNHITLAPGIVVSKGAQQWSFNTTGTQHIATSGVGATINNAGGFFVAGSGVGGQTLVIDSGITIQGHGQIFDSATAPVINAGTIVAASAGQVFTVASSTFSNTGLLKVTAGTMTISSPNWTSTGTMQVDAGTLNLGGTLTAGTFNTIVRPGAGAGTVVNVTGTFDGAGGTLDIGSAGQFGNGGLNGLSGTLKSLTLVSTDLTQVPGGGILDGVTLGSNLTFAGSAAIRNHITLAPGIVVSKGAQQWSFNTTGTQHIATSGVGATINNAGGFFVAGSGVGGQTLVIDSGITIQGHGQIFDSATAPVINAGTIVASTAGQSFTISSTTFTNSGMLRVLNGATMSRPGGFTNSPTGIIESSGTFSVGAGNTLTNDGTLRPGTSPGFTTITGNLVLGATSVTEFEMGGLTRGTDPGYDSIHATGTVTINAGATATLIYQNGFTANIGDTLIGITAAGGPITGSFTSVIPPVGPGGPEAFVTATLGNTVFFQRGTVFTGVNVWTNTADGNWNVASNWSAGVPVAGQIVIIDLGPTFNPTISVTDTQVSGRLQSTENVSVSGSAIWTISDDSTINAALTMNAAAIDGSGGLTVNGPFNWSGGQLRGTGSFVTTGTTTIGGDVSLSGRTWSQNNVLDLNGGNVGRVTIDNGAVLNNAGVMTINSTRTDPLTSFTGGGALNNSGTLVKAAAGDSQINSIGSFNSTGLVRVDAGLLTINVGGTDTNGLYEVGAGAQLRFNSGTRTLAGTTDVTGAGAVFFSGATVNVNGGYSIDATGTTTVNGGAATFNTAALDFVNGLTFNGAAIAGSADVTVSGPFNWSGGQLRGTGSFVTTGTTTIGGDVSLSGRTWSQNNVLDLNGGNVGRVTIDNGAVLNNAGVMTINSTRTDPLTSFTGGGALNNSGTLVKAAAGDSQINSIGSFNSTGLVRVDAGLLTINVGGTDTNGLYEVGAGAQLRFNSGTRTLAGTTDVTGAGAVFFSGATVNVNGGYSIDATGTTTVNGGAATFNTAALDFVNGLTFNGAAIAGSADVTVSGPFNWSGGQLRGTGSFVTTGTTTIGGDVSLSGRTWSQNNVLDLNGGNVGRVTIDNGAVLNNAGVMTINSTRTDPLTSFTGGGALNNSGTLVKAAAGDSQINSIGSFNSTGLVRVDAGLLTINVGGTDTNGLYEVGAGAQLRFNSGTRTLAGTTDVTGAGAVFFSGATVNVNGGYSIDATGTTTVNGGAATFNTAALDFVNGLTFNGAAIAGSADVTVSGPFNWSGGQLRGTGSFVTTGTTTIGGDVSLSGRTWSQNNVLDLNGGSVGRVTIDNGAVLNNAGVMTINSTRTDPLTSFTGGGALNNSGTLVKAAAGDSQINSIGSVANTGTIAAQNGTLTVNASFPINAGVIELVSGAVLSTGGRNLSNAFGGTIGGQGALDLTTATLSNAGVLRPGAASGTTTGTLTITGNVTQTATGVVNLEIGPTAANADLLAISGTHMMTGGTINVAGVSGFSGPLVNTTLITYGAGVGTLTPGNVIADLVLDYGSTGVSASTIVGGANFWNVDGDGDWNNAANWSRNHVPQEDEDVVIDRTDGLFSITISGAQLVRSLTTNENIVLSNNGSLDVSQASLWNNLLTISGGTLTGAGSKTINTLSLSAGAITGTGNVTVTNNYTHAGGTISIGGNLDITQAAGNLLIGGAISANSIVARALSGNVTVNAPLSAAGNILLDAQGASSDLIIAANITKSAGAPAAFEGRAANSVLVINGADITSADGVFTVILNSDRDALNGGAIRMDAGTSIVSGGGDIALGGGASPTTTAAAGTATDRNGVQLANAQLQSAAGAITIMGRGLNGVSGASGVRIAGGSLVQSTSGSIDITGTGGGGESVVRNVGVLLEGNGTRVTSDSGGIDITGDNRAAAVAVSSSRSHGVLINDRAVIESTGSAPITVEGRGTSAPSGSLNMGVMLEDDAASIVGNGGRIVSTATGSGAISVTGFGGGGGTSRADLGVTLTRGGRIESFGAGPITVKGTSGSGSGGDSRGTDLQLGAVIATTGAPITIQGTGGGSGGNPIGVAMFFDARVESQTGAIDVTGSGATGGDGFLMDNLGSTGTRLGSVTGDILVRSLGGPIALGVASGTNDLISTTGNLTLDAVAGVNQAASSRIAASGLRLLGAGAFNLDQAANDIGTLAAGLSGSSIVYRDANALAIGNVIGTVGITLPQVAGNSVALTAGGNVDFIENAAISAGSVNITAGGNIVGGSAPADIDTAGANGAINLTTNGASSAIGAASNPIAMSFGGGSIGLTTSNGSIFVQQSVGDLLTGRFTQNSGTGTASYELSTANGKITVNDTAAWNSDDNIVFSTAGAAKDIEFTASGTVIANTLTLSGTGNIVFPGSPQVTYDTAVTANLPVSIGGGSISFEKAATFLASVTLSNGTLGGAGEKSFGALNLSHGMIGGPGIVTLRGTLSSTGVSSIAGPVTNNGGTVNVIDGTLTLSAPYLQTGSSTQIAAGATLAVPAGMTMSSGDLAGSGTVAGDVANSGGTVQPGGAGAEGTLTIIGNYTQEAGGALSIDLAGTSAGEADRLKVEGAASLSGMLNITAIKNYRDSPGDTVEVLSAQSRSGAFSTVNGRSAFLLSPIALYGDKFVQVSIAPAETNTWNRNADGNWNDPNNWNLGHVPRADEAVLINRPNGLFNITYSTGDVSVRSLVNEENMLLSGGTLSVSQPSFWNETLHIAGGALAGPGDKTIKNLILDSGEIRGAGNVSVTGSFTQTAGIIDIGAALSITQGTGALTVAAPLSAGSIGLAAMGAADGGALNVNGPLSSTGNIELISTGPTAIRANVTSGSLIRAVSQGNFNVFGAMVTGPRIQLAFPNASQDFFVNGVQAAVTSGSAGFFSGGVPAVLGTTLAVTYGDSTGGPSPVASDPVVVAAINEVIEATTRVFDPMNLLGADDGTSQFKIQSDGGPAIVDSTAREVEAEIRECR